MTLHTQPRKHTVLPLLFGYSTLQLSTSLEGLRLGYDGTVDRKQHIILSLTVVRL